MKDEYLANISLQQLDVPMDQLTPPAPTSPVADEQGWAKEG